MVPYGSRMFTRSSLAVGLAAQRQSQLGDKREADARALAKPTVERSREDVYHFRDGENGADPMWVLGIDLPGAGGGGELFASGLETLEGMQPLNNIALALFRRVQRGGNRSRRMRRAHARAVPDCWLLRWPAFSRPTRRC